MTLFSIPITAVAATVTTIGGAILTVRRLIRGYEKDKNEHSAKILQLAKESDSALKSNLDGKIHELQLEMDNMKESISKDLNHIKETYQNDIKYLGEKIQSLRDEISRQHVDLLTLLNKMIERK